MSDSALLSTNENDDNWKVVEIENKQYLVSMEIKNDVYKVLLTNLIELWMEQLTNEIILQRCAELNPSLDIEAFDVKTFVINLMKNIPKYLTKFSTDYIHLSTTLYDGIFKFSIKLTKCNPQQLWEEVTLKLCKAVIINQQKFNILLDIIDKKDKEIIEYKLEGAKLIRKNIETEQFDLVKFNKECPKFDYSVNCLNTVGNVMNASSFFEEESDKSSKLSTHSVGKESNRNSTTESPNIIIKEEEVDGIECSKNPLETLPKNNCSEGKILTSNELKNKSSEKSPSELQKYTVCSSTDESKSFVTTTLNKRSNISCVEYKIDKPVKKIKKTLRHYVF